ncbi:hypothetical protein GCM10009804_11590 [Kribbella hippodromi]|uniref:Uncharacterized protein n=1 Tax=Kribbella hippodromi TaxID=434347 RepID=A0ABP4N6J5_9ACTN
MTDNRSRRTYTPPKAQLNLVIRSRRLAAGGAALATATALAGCTWSLHLTHNQPPTASSAPPATVIATGATPRIVRSDSASPSGAEAALTTTLTTDPNGCVQAANGKITLIWPRTYSIQGTPDSFKILDADDHVVARSGTPLTIGGGGATTINPTWTTQSCPTATQLWLVGTITPTR